MNNIHIAMTARTPAVKFEGTGRLMIEGRSQPKDADVFYDPLIKWVGLYDGEVVNLDMNLDYLNTVSSKKILELLRTLDANHRIRELTISWYYEVDDEETLEKGLLYEELLQKASFVFHELSESPGAR